MAVIASGRPARSHVEPIARFELCDLLRVRLATGRTHQIRVHLAHIGHPVVGDPVYGGGGSRRISGAARQPADQLERATPRQALHAAQLGFRHPESGEPVTFRSEWPADLRAALAIASGGAISVAEPDPLRYLGFFGQHDQ
jgi:23S rRNA pseudouridine1911/1915/1917 synthase